MKKLLLSVLLLFVVCNQLAYCENLCERLRVGERKQLKKGTLYSIVRDNKSGIEYLIVESNLPFGGYAITPLIKPAIYVHKK